ncbi:dihydrofolate reductase family protein [Actinomadura sp. 1N219]|uniref:dihydrofolate reductase family protein n=1 Tax=Actinomadura sp. 1N219 TaxID=3375152 RepID=UPI0037A6B4EC
MGRIYSSTYVSLDGVMESPDSWNHPYFSQEMADLLAAELETAQGMLLGRSTYEMFASFFPHQSSDVPFADLNNNMRKFVVSTTLDDAEWNNTTLIKQDVPETLRELKKDRDGDLHVSGSATLVRYLLDQDLLDEVRLVVSPVLVGTGRRLFMEKASHKALELIESKPLPHGVLSLVYRPVVQ